MISRILIEAGYKTGLYTSPHLERYNERYKINNEEISDDAFGEYIERVKLCADDMDGGAGRPTVFEQLRQPRFIFCRPKVDYAVIEVGLEEIRRHKCYKKPVLSVITSISLDHTEFLGNTIESIAFEKGGIIRKNARLSFTDRTGGYMM